MCHDTGWLKRAFGPETNWKTEIVRCDCQREQDRRRIWDRARRASNLTPEMERMTFASFRRERNLEAAELLWRWAQQPSGWIVLMGPPGTGKTHLLAALANRLMTTDNRALYVIAPELLRFLRTGIGTGDMERRFDQAREVDVLLLDDLGAEQQTEWAEEQFYLLLDHRYRSQAPTVIATNLKPHDLPMRIRSRMQDRAFSQVIVMDGEDYRLSDERAKQANLGW